MKFINLAEERYSLRKFSDKPIEKEKLDLVLKAGQLAPTACNYQPQRILVIENEDALAKLKLCTQYHFNAPMALLICYDKAVSWKRSFDGKDSGDIDSSIVTTHMMLQAAEVGLGTTWVGHFDPALIIKEFALPDNIVPVALLPLGYPAKDATQNPLHIKSRPIEETVFYNDFSE
ncbi:MAG: nitroreductase family protein [Desulfosporosinus sp.]|nr:nitroreductase family protein [Desulfosporosinus sp.]